MPRLLTLAMFPVLVWMYVRLARGEADFADKVLSAMRYAFGGHQERMAERPGRAPHDEPPPDRVPG